MKGLHATAFLLVIIGSLNWLFIGFFKFGIENFTGPTLARIIYVLVGLSAIYLIATHKKSCRMCESKPSNTPTNPTGM
jgi:uncharacterized membrane protein YuzA (DUF378 family)